MLLVFTEIIEINICDLQKNTKKNISERSIEQSEFPLFDEDNSRDRDSLVEIEGYEIEIKSKETYNKDKKNSENNE